MFHSLNLICFQSMCLICFFFFTMIFCWSLHHTKCCIETPSFYKNISIECIYFHGSVASGPASYKVSHKQQSRDLVNLLGLSPLIRRWVLGQQQKRKEKITGVSFVSLFFCLDFFLPVFFFPIRKKLNCWSEQRAEHTGVIQRGGMGPGSRGG